MLFQILNVFFISVSDDLYGDSYTAELKEMQTDFNRRFEDTFGLRKRGYDDKAIRFAQAAMSNMIGGIGYFYGHSMVM